MHLKGCDVFFTTSVLLPQDPGQIDVYDARVGGGFPQPVTLPICEGETCQGPSNPPPEFPTPASATFNGPGNVKPKPKRCPKGKRKVKRKGKVRCVKKPHKTKRGSRRSKRHHSSGGAK
jgi:hypothetical protein